MSKFKEGDIVCQAQNLDDKYKFLRYEEDGTLVLERLTNGEVVRTIWEKLLVAVNYQNDHLPCQTRGQEELKTEFRKFKEGDIVDWNRDDVNSPSHHGYEVIENKGDITIIECRVTRCISQAKTSDLELRYRDANKLTKTSDAGQRQEGGEHYKVSDIEPWDVIDTWPMEQRIGYYRGNLLKYTMRCGLKDAQETEIKKAIHYGEKLLETLEEKNKKEV